jgi:hypothetical protein
MRHEIAGFLAPAADSTPSEGLLTTIFWASTAGEPASFDRLLDNRDGLRYNAAHRLGAVDRTWFSRRIADGHALENTSLGRQNQIKKNPRSGARGEIVAAP